jgi:alpha-L-fucosidase
MLRFFTTLVLCYCLLPLPSVAQQPTAAQLAWHETEFYLFLHFGPNTFTDVEWGHGTEPEDIFNPSALDCDQWCRVAKQAGAKGLVITAKHHDGFCLWPSQFSKHTVRESKWRNGQGDVLRELSDACQRHGLLLGFYLSPWDRNHPQYGTPEYNDVYVSTMTELMTQYGSLFEFWWDGANGEGPNGKKQVYDFHRFEKTAAQLQPNAVIFSDIGPGCRWAGNEQGTVGDPNWCTLDTASFARGLGAPPNDTLQHGNANGAHWIPAECDVSIRPGWFYHAEEDNKVKTPQQLWDIYLKSVGRGANLILNVPPDRQGRIHERDSVALVEFGNLRRDRFAKNLAAGKTARVGGAQVNAALTDGNLKTFVKLSKNSKKRLITIDLGSEQTVSLVKIQENVANGQRVSAFTVAAWQDNQWRKVAEGTTIGYRRILELPQPVRTQRLRVQVLNTKPGGAEISEIGVF